jgi:hypothetical protein
MTNSVYCRKIIAGCCAIFLTTTGALAFQQTTITRQRSVNTSPSLSSPLEKTRLPELRLHLGGEGITERGGNNLRKQRGSRLVSSTRLSVSAKRSLGRGSKSKPLIPENFQGRLKLGISTTLRVFVPSILAGVLAFFAFPSLSLWLCSLFQDQGVFAVLSQDSSQFVQNFLSVSSLLFSILVGQTYYFMYQQQEMVYYALFDEVTEAKSLLEQVALVSQGRTMYGRVLACMSTYVQSDLKALEKDPAVLLSSRPMDDPLETIMYLVSPFLGDNNNEVSLCNSGVRSCLTVNQNQLNGYNIDSNATSVATGGIPSSSTPIHQPNSCGIPGPAREIEATSERRNIGSINIVISMSPMFFICS